MLKIGDVAPDFSLKATSGEEISLSSLRGHPVVLYFYPEDHTLGCTMEARGFRAYFDSYRRDNVSILGISQDTYEQHCSFQTKLGLPFELLSDCEGDVHDLYDAWKRRRKAKQTHRCTYIIDPEGKIAKVYPRVRVLSHAGQVLRDVERLASEGNWFVSSS